MKFSIVPLLIFILLAFWHRLGARALQRGRITTGHWYALRVWLVLLLAWGVLSTGLAQFGIYRSPAFYALLPGLWVPLAPVVLTLILLALWPRFAQALRQVTEATPARAFLWVHALRISAIGGIAKAMDGLLPTSFVYAVGIPDMAFGMLSLALAWAHGARGYTRRTLLRWNLTGMAVLASAPLLMQAGLPGPFHVLRSVPDARTLFEFPLVLAPTWVVTLLFFMNGWHAYVLWRPTPGRESGAPQLPSAS